MNNYEKVFHGIIPALITPYDQEGNINELVTRQLIRHLLSKGVHGFYISGSTGEGFLQTIEERKNFMDIVLDEVSSEVPVIVQVGAMDTNTCIDLTKYADQKGADAVSAVAPFYYNHESKEVREHYLSIVKAADIPLIIYHFPSSTGVNSSTQFYKELSQEKNIIGVKFTSRDVFEMQQVINSCEEDFLVFNGPDEICVAGLTMGAKGAIGSTYNIMPELFVTLYNEYKSGNIQKAVALQYKANALIKELLKYNFIAFEKEILRLQGFEVGLGRKPIQQLTGKEKDEISGIYLKLRNAN